MEFSSFCIAQATRSLDRLAFAIRAAARSHSPEAVHDLRVAVRRFTQALAVGKPYFASRDVRKIRRRLKAVMKLAGEARDCDIALKLVARSKSKDVAAVEMKFRARRVAAGRTLAVSLRQLTSRNPFPKWRRELADRTAASPGLTTEDAARRKLPRLAERFFREGQSAANQESSANELHAFRLAAKKFRYTLELFADVYGPVAGDWLEQLKAAQNLLGAISDCTVTKRLVEKLGAGDEMVAGLKRRQKRKIREFRRAWEEWLAGTAKQWQHAFQHPSRKPMARAEAHDRLGMRQGRTGI